MLKSTYHDSLGIKRTPISFDLYLSLWKLKTSTFFVTWFGSLPIQESHVIHALASIFANTAPQGALHFRATPVFVMAEKQGHSSAHSSSPKLVCPVSIVSLLICTAALVRVEIINQRVHDVEDLVADARHNQNLIKVFTDAASFKRSERVESEGEFNHKITEERRDEAEGKVFGLLSQCVTFRQKFILFPFRDIMLSRATKV